MCPPQFSDIHLFITIIRHFPFQLLIIARSANFTRVFSSQVQNIEVYLAIIKLKTTTTSTTKKQTKERKLSYLGIYYNLGQNRVIYQSPHCHISCLHGTFLVQGRVVESRVRLTQG